MRSYYNAQRKKAVEPVKISIVDTLAGIALMSFFPLVMVYCFFWNTDGGKLMDFPTAIGYIFGVMLMFWIGWQMIKTLNPLLVVVGVCIWFGVASAIFEFMLSYIKVSFTWVETIIHSMFSLLPFVN